MEGVGVAWMVFLTYWGFAIKAERKLSPSRIAISTGDPVGIGPEITIKAAHSLHQRVALGELGLVLFGPIVAHPAVFAELGIEDHPQAVRLDEINGPRTRIVFVDVGSATNECQSVLQRLMAGESLFAQKPGKDRVAHAI
jgi:hypothetical protein